MNIHSIFRVVSPIFRRRRRRIFLRELAPAPGTSVLDVGGYPDNWRDFPVRLRLTVVNVDAPVGTAASGVEGCEFVAGDGTKLGYADGAFEVLFSNSVIEHVGTFERQRQFAAEARRVGRKLWVQTPARCFFIEPHLLTPFIHWLPRNIQKKLLRHATVWGWLTRPDEAAVENFLNEVRLLDYREMQALFPDCRIRRERFLGMTKSYIAVRGGESPRQVRLDIGG